jgi:hypothetical protein
VLKVVSGKFRNLKFESFFINRGKTGGRFSIKYKNAAKIGTGLQIYVMHFVCAFRTSVEFRYDKDKKKKIK